MEYYVCCTCNSPSNLVKLSCDHVICEPCFQLTLQRWNYKSIIQCPVDGFQINIDNIQRFLNIRDYLSSVRVNCTNDGCTWSGPALQFEEYHIADCQYQIIDCIYQPCTAKFLRSQKIAHEEKDCPYIIVKCPNEGCFHSYYRIQKSLHEEVCMANMLVPCKNSGCTILYVRKEKDLHESKCLFELLLCNQMNCNTYYLRKDKDVHKEMCIGNVKCEKCQQIVKRALLNEHHRECPNEIVECIADLCREKIFRKDLQSHILICPYVFNCTFCQGVFAKKEELNHLKECVTGRNLCPFGCKEEVLNEEGTKTQCTEHEECCQHAKEQIPSPGKKKVRRDSVNYSYGRFVWEYETAGIPITDDVMVDITIPRLTAVESPGKDTLCNTTQYEGSIISISTTPSPKKTGKIIPYTKIGLNRSSRKRRHSSPYKKDFHVTDLNFHANLKEIMELRDQLKRQGEEIVWLKQYSNQTNKIVENLKNDKKNLINELNYLKEKALFYVGKKIVWEITHFSEKLLISKLHSIMIDANSPVFYTGYPGYKCIANAYIYFQSETHQGLHIGFTLMKGKYDSIIKWPFLHEIKITLFNQKCDVEPIVKTKRLSRDNSRQPVMDSDNDQQVIDFIFYEELKDYISENDILFAECEIIEESRKRRGDTFDDTPYKKQRKTRRN